MVDAFTVETWKEIPFLPGRFASSNGRLKTHLNSKRVIDPKHEKILTSKVNSAGYFILCIGYKKSKRSFLVHRIVAMVFIDNPESKPEINHIDGDKTNNKVSNLEWCTRVENMKHAKDTGLMNINRKKIKKLHT